MKDFFVLPTNIKQIGSIGDGMRIYMEDYVCTYLNQYAQAGGYDERLALLVGRYLLIDGQPILFINGAIQGKYTENEDGLLHFTEKTSAYAEAMIDEFFEGMEVVGWMQTQPGYGIFLNQQYAAYHFREFPKINQVMFVMDPLENVNAFYSYNDDRTALAEARGYFIYYDRNTHMHEYMLSNKATESEYTAQSASYLEMPKMERVEDPDAHFDDERSPEGVIRKRLEQRSSSKKSIREQRRTLNLLVSMSAVLFVVCFVLGAGLIQSQTRIETMETQLIQLNAAYRNLYTQVANPVFAPGAEPSIGGGSYTANVGMEVNIDSPDYIIVDDELPDTVEEEADGSLVIDGIPVGPPVNAPAPTPTPAGGNQQTIRSIPETYVIQPGDSLSAISLYFYGEDRVSDILALNNMEDANMIIAGRSILLP